MPSEIQQELQRESSKKNDDFIQLLDQKYAYYEKRRAHFEKAYRYNEIYLRDSHFEKSKLYEDLKQIFISHRNLYAISSRDDEAKAQCVHDITKDVSELRISKNV